MITQHHVIGAGWMLWTVAAAVWPGLLLFGPVQAPSWMVLPGFISMFAFLMWIVFHMLALAFWLGTRPQP